MAERIVRLAAIGDLHFDERARGSLSKLLERVRREADIFALVGDLTKHGLPEQMRALVEELRGLKLPIVAVLGNHDFEAELADEMSRILHEAGIAVLDGNVVEIQGIGFTGVKGFAGGFGRAALGPFGEKLIKDFVQTAVDEALKLERGLRELRTDRRVVLIHYAPITETVRGESEQVYAYLGSSRLLDPIETMGADLVLHGHAHNGTYRGTTPSGIPVYNVSVDVLKAAGLELHIEEIPAPDRRRAEAPPAAG